MKIEGKDIFVDIDGTICTGTYPEYEKAEPIPHRIERVNKWYEDGFNVTYWTARGSLEKNQTRKINIINLTQKQLKEWGCKYHFLKFRKPVYGLLIDDRAVSDNFLEGGELCSEQKT